MKSHSNEEIAAIRNPVTYKEAQAEQGRLDPKWLMVNGVEPKIDGSLLVDVISGGDTQHNKCLPSGVNWDVVIKYRLHNGSGYKDGIAIDEHDATRFTLQENGDYLEDKIDNGPLARHYKLDPNFADEHADCKITELKEQNASGWVDGLPPIGVVFILENEYGNYDYEMLAHHGGWFWAREISTNEYVSRLISSTTFQPILTPKQRTINAAAGVIQDYDGLDKLYDAGFLVLPGDSNE